MEKNNIRLSITSEKCEKSKKVNDGVAFRQQKVASRHPFIRQLAEAARDLKPGQKVYYRVREIPNAVTTQNQS